MTNTYSYITADNKTAQVNADTPEQAMASATNIAKNSGVQLYSRVNPGTPMPTTAQTTTTTPPATTTNAAAATPAAPTAAPVYSRVPSALDTAKTAYEQTLTTSPVAPNEDAMRAQARERATAIVDSINQSYVPQYQQVDERADRRSRTAQALAVSGGQRGSDFATAKKETVLDEKDEDVRLLNMEKQAKITEVLTGAEERASKDYQTRRSEYLNEIQGNYEKIAAFQKANAETARAEITTLAAQGVALTALKSQSPDIYKQLLEESGLSEPVFNAVYNSQLPENQKRSYEYKTIGNTMYAISVNPATKKVETEKIGEANEGFDQFLITPDGTPLFVNKETGQIKEAGANYAKPIVPKGGGVKDTSAQDAQDAYNAVQAGANIDAVRREYLKDHPTKTSVFNSYFKTTKPATGTTRAI